MIGIQSQLVITETYDSKITLEEKILTLQHNVADLYEKWSQIINDSPYLLCIHTLNRKK